MGEGFGLVVGWISTIRYRQAVEKMSRGRSCVEGAVPRGVGGLVEEDPIQAHSVRVLSRIYTTIGTPRYP